MLLRRPLLRKISAGKVTGSLRRRKTGGGIPHRQRCFKSFLTFILIVTIASALLAQTPKPEATQYTCVMHPEVVQDHPGKCPKCGMELVPAKTNNKHPTSNSEHPTPKSEAVNRNAQHDMEGRAPSRPTQETTQGPSSHYDHTMHEMKMQSSVNLTEPMTREGSGTSWLPDSSPMYGRMFMLGDDMLMLHGAIFPRYTNVSTRRGDDRIDAPNWLMAMFSHPLGDSAQLGVRLMMSLDPLTEGGRGYPLLFQSGESWHDQPLHDRQHPHDLFDELSLAYSQKFTPDLSALHLFRLSGRARPRAAHVHASRFARWMIPMRRLGHHWQDSSHVTFGVATAGLVWRTVKIEGAFLPDASRTKTATILIGRDSIPPADAFPGTRRRILPCNSRMAT